MKTLRTLTFGLVAIGIVSMTGFACKMNRTKKGALIGAGSGAVIGAVVGRASGNTALGAIIGATVGGTAGVIIGNKMDKQAKEIENSVDGAKVTRVGEGIIVEFSSKILFGFDQSNLSDVAKLNLDRLVVVLNKYPDTDIEIQGHTDSIGTEKYNMALSRRRAGAVSDYLLTKGISGSRITSVGYGELAPNYSNSTEENRALNRRVEFLITANEKMIEEAKKEAATK